MNTSSPSASSSKTAEMAHFLLDTMDQVDAWLGSTVETNDDNDDGSIGYYNNDGSRCHNARDDDDDEAAAMVVAIASYLLNLRSTNTAVG